MKISFKKRERISEQILLFLYTKNPQPLFTSEIAREMARDEEFIKKLLTDLKNKGLVVLIAKNSQGKKYLRRQRWTLSDSAYRIYKGYQ
jgi:DNA-binding IscR family transcriptional regulator